jgi:transposase-like protein
MEASSPGQQRRDMPTEMFGIPIIPLSHGRSERFTVATKRGIVALVDEYKQPIRQVARWFNCSPKCIRQILKLRDAVNEATTSGGEGCADSRSACVVVVAGSRA